MPVPVPEVLHPPADLRPFVEGVDESLAEPLTVLGTRPRNLENGARVRLPPVRVCDQTSDHMLWGL